jgi:hypothetical protein
LREAGRQPNQHGAEHHDSQNAHLLIPRLAGIPAQPEVEDNAIVLTEHTPD